MLTFDQIKSDFYDSKLGLIKIGILLARKYPNRVDQFMECRSVVELADAAEIPRTELFYDTGIRLLREWLEAKGLL